MTNGSNATTNPPNQKAARKQTWLDRLITGSIIWLVVFYRCTFGILLGGHCRFYPSCSQYMLDAVKKYGPWRGVWRGLKRISRCHPLSKKCGHDPA